MGAIAGSSRTSSYRVALGAEIGRTPDGPEVVSRSLLLAAHVPSRLELGWSCGRAPSTAGRWFSSSVGLEVTDRLGMDADTTAAGRWSLTLNGVAFADIPAGRGDRCLFRIQEPGYWEVLRDGAVEMSGTTTMPSVTALSTQLPLGSDDVVEALIVTRAHGLVTSWPRTLARLITALALCGAVLLRAWPRLSWRKPSPTVAWTSFALTGLLAVLAFVEPPFEDDGWVLATVENFGLTGQFGNYYNSWNSTYVSGAGFFHVLRWFFDISPSPLMLRLPALGATLAAWWLVCGVLRRLSDGDHRRWSRSCWLALPFFGLASVSWLVTLRPEPYLTLLSAAVLFACVRLVQRGDAIWLYLAFIASGAALAVHPAGITVCAPVVAVVPELVAAVRNRAIRWIDLGLALVVAAASSVWLVLVDLDVGGLRVAAAANTNPGNVTYTWRDAAAHYQNLFDLGNGPRRLTWLVCIVALVAYVSRPRNEARVIGSAVAMRSFVVGSVLLAWLPSKWLWHFGALSAIGAVLVAVELEHLTRRRTARSGWSVVAITGTTVVSLAVAWNRGLHWLGQTDLVAWGYTAYATDLGRLPVDLAAPRTWVLMTLVVAGALWIRSWFRADRDRRPLTQVPSMLAAAVTTGGIVATLGISVAMLVVAPVSRGSRWTLPAQLFRSVSSSTCGLADELQVIVPAWPTVLAVDDDVDAAANGPPLTGSEAGNPPAWPSLASAVWTWAAPAAHAAVSAWFDISHASAWTVDVFRSDPSLRVRAEYAVLEGSAAGHLGMEWLDPGVDAQWSTVQLRADGATHVRLVAVAGDGGTPGAWVGAAVPATALPGTLDEFLGSAPVWVSPYLRFYFPCVRSPGIDGGVTEVPRFALDSSVWSIRGDLTSTVRFVGDVASSRRLLLRWQDGSGSAPVVVLDELVPLVGVDTSPADASS